MSWDYNSKFWIILKRTWNNILSGYVIVNWNNRLLTQIAPFQKLKQFNS